MDYRRARRTPWIIVILIVAAICLVSFLGAYIYHSASKDTSFGSYTSVAGAQSMQVQLAGDGFVFCTYNNMQGFILEEYLDYGYH